MGDRTRHQNEFTCGDCRLRLWVTTEHASGTTVVPSSERRCPGCGRWFKFPGIVKNFSRRLANGQWETVEEEK